MRLLLLHPHFPYRGKDLFPIGLGYLAGVAKEKAEVKVIDEGVEPFTAEKLMRFKPHYVGITSTTPSFSRARELISTVKEKMPGAKVISGGVHSTFRPEEALKAGADVAVRGEGEETLREVISGRELEDIEGISYRDGGEIVHNKAREPVKDLDSLPTPAWEFFPLQSYRIMSLISARGCPYACSYCSASSFWGHRVRFRSPENFMEEVKALYALGKRRLRFMDSTFTLDRERALDICSLMEEEGFENFTYSIETRADHLDGELLKALRRSGCDLICLGVDSGSQEVLDACKRGVRVEETREGIIKAREEGLKVRAYVTFGFPGETRESVESTVSLLRRTRPEQILLSLATAYPGTELEGGRKIQIHPNWVEKFQGHGPNAELYFPRSLERRDYTRLGDYLYREVKRLNRER